MIRIAPNEDVSLEIVSPSLGTTLIVGESHSIDFSGKDELSTAFLEINGKIQWSSVLSLDGTLLPGSRHLYCR